MPRINYQVSLEPIVDTTYEIDYTDTSLGDITGIPHSFHHNTVNGIIGTESNITSNMTQVNGYTSGRPVYLNAATTPVITASNSCAILYIKHTGKAFNTTSAIGDNNVSNTITVTVGSSVISTLHAGDSLVLPRPTANTQFTITGTAGAVEHYMSGNASGGGG